MKTDERLATQPRKVLSSEVAVNSGGMLYLVSTFDVCTDCSCYMCSCTNNLSVADENNVNFLT